MNTIIRNALVRLVPGPSAGSPEDVAIPNQTLAIHRSNPDAVIHMDGHMGFRDSVVEVCWRGLHTQRLRGVARVEILDPAGRMVESLPVDATRRPREEDGETVFFLVDAD